MFSGSAIAGRGEMLMELKGIGKLNVGEVCLLELKARLGELDSQ